MCIIITISTAPAYNYYGDFELFLLEALWNSKSSTNKL
jgi:hypothetical protein